MFICVCVCELLSCTYSMLYIRVMLTTNVGTVGRLYEFTSVVVFVGHHHTRYIHRNQCNVCVLPLRTDVIEIILCITSLSPPQNTLLKTHLAHPPTPSLLSQSSISHSITHSHSSISVIPSTSFTPTLFIHSRYSTFVETLFPPFLHLYNLYSIRTSCSLLPLVLSGTCPLTHSHT